MKNIILFSNPLPSVIQSLDQKVFTNDLNGKSFCYLPCEGNDPRNEVYIPMWKERVIKHSGFFHFIDNSKSAKDSAKEKELIEQADIVFIPGGNTFHLKRNLVTSSLWDSLRNFFTHKNYIYLGMSAGAIIISPTIEFANDHGFASGFDKNDVGIQDLDGLGIIDFEPLVHFDPEHDTSALEQYSHNSVHKIRTITDEEIVSIVL